MNIKELFLKPIDRPINGVIKADQNYLETEADVEAFVSKLKTELLVAIRAGQRTRLQ